MDTLLLDGESEADILKAADILKRGGLAAFPTETVYGLGANALDDAACAKIYKAKRRPADNPLIAHVTSLETLSAIAEPWNAKTDNLIKAFWPGALTLLFNRKKGVCETAACGLPTIAARFPSNKTAQRIIEASGLPIAAPSANISGKPSPTRFIHVLEDLTGVIGAIVDGGDCAFGVESTVIDVSGKFPVLLRPGAVSRLEIETLLGERLLNPADAEKPSAPGMKYRHYAPKAPLYIIDDRENFTATYKNNEGANVFMLCAQANAARYKELGANVISLGNDARDAARNLFAALRQADAQGANVIYAEAFNEKSGSEFTEVYQNRLFKAGEAYERHTDYQHE